MALPTKSELFARIAQSPEKMEPKRYPFEYAMDLLNQHNSILPPEFRQNVVSQMQYPFPTVIIERWAQEEGENIFAFASALADAYLELNGIAPLEEMPVLTSRAEWMEWLDVVCPD